MKIEDIVLEEPETVDKNLSIEEWRATRKMDYFKAAAILLQSDDPSVRNVVFKTIYEITRCFIPKTVYKYYSLGDDKKKNRTRFDTLYNGQIYMSDIRDFNDPFDGQGFYYKPDKLADISRLKHCNGSLIDDFREYGKVACFTGNGVQSMPMWAHYSNNHMGFCVAYDVMENPELNSGLFPVQYIDQRLDITTEMRRQAEKICHSIDESESQREVNIYYDDITIVFLALLLYNIKGKNWEYENEFRCTSGSQSEGMHYMRAKPKCIYVGKDCSKENASYLYDIADHFGIIINKMEYKDDSDAYELVAREFYK